MCRPSSRFPSIASVAQPCPQHLRSQRDAPVEGSVPGAPTVVVHVLEDRTIYACAETSRAAGAEQRQGGGVALPIDSPIHGPTPGPLALLWQLARSYSGCFAPGCFGG